MYYLILHISVLFCLFPRYYEVLYYSLYWYVHIFHTTKLACSCLALRARCCTADSGATAAAILPPEDVWYTAPTVKSRGGMRGHSGVAISRF